RGLCDGESFSWRGPLRTFPVAGWGSCPGGTGLWERGGEAAQCVTPKALRLSDGRQRDPRADRRADQDGTRAAVQAGGWRTHDGRGARRAQGRRRGAGSVLGPAAAAPGATRVRRGSGRRQGAVGLRGRTLLAVAGLPIRPDEVLGTLFQCGSQGFLITEKSATGW